MKSFLRVATIAIACQSLTLHPAHAGFMDDFFTSAGAAANVTPTDIRQTGSAGFITGGSVVWRVPNRTFVPFRYSPPSIKAGCGGIDLFLGAFGFANTSQFVDYLRNIGQNALGLFFKMALKAMSPELEGAISELSAQLNSLNTSMRDSCKVAGDLLAGAGISDKTFNDNSEYAARYARGRGAVTDAFSGLMTYGSNQAATNGEVDSAASANNAGGKPVSKASRNFVWSAMNSGSLSGFPDELKEVAQSLIGVTGAVASATDPDVMEPIVLAETVHMRDLVGSWDRDQVDLTILACNDMDECLAPTGTVRAQRPFARMAYLNLLRLRDKILNRTPLDATDSEAVVMLGLTSLPVWKILELTSSPGRLWLSDDYIRKYANVIGYELAINFIISFSSDIDKTINTSAKTERSANVQQYLEQVKLRLARLRTEAREVKVQIDSNSMSYASMVSELEHLERTLYQNLSTRTLDSMKYASR
jgi:conjugative transfer pilus assembly protein TraH